MKANIFFKNETTSFDSYFTGEVSEDPHFLQHKKVEGNKL